MTFFLAHGEQSYASAMFHWDPWFAMKESHAFQVAVRQLFGSTPEDAPWWVTASLAPFWLLAHLGLIGIGTLFFVIRHGRRLDLAQAWILWSAAAGAVPALFLAAPGFSQLFFLYDSQVVLALLASSCIAERWLPRRGRSLAASLAIACFALPMLTGSARGVAEELARDVRPPPPEPPVVEAYREGLDWIREHTPADALLLVRHRWILVSAFAERRAFYETDLFTPDRHRLRRGGNHDTGSVFPEHATLRKRAFSRAGGITLAEIDALVPGSRCVYVIHDDVQLVGRDQQLHYEIGPVPPATDPAPPGSPPPVFENQALRIFRLEGDGGA